MIERTGVDAGCAAGRAYDRRPLRLAASWKKGPARAAMNAPVAPASPTVAAAGNPQSRSATRSRWQCALDP